MRLNEGRVPRMWRWITVRWLVILAIVALGVAACTGSAASLEATAASPAASATASLAIPSTGSSTTSDRPAPSRGEPPQATLAAEGGDPVAGTLGSFTWGDGGSDSPWLPGAPIAVAPGEPLTVHLADDVPIVDWTAKRDAATTADGIGAVAIATGGAALVSFPALPPGAWSVQLVITFGDGLGSGAYYWTVTVR